MIGVRAWEGANVAINRQKGLEQLKKQLSDGAMSILSERPEKQVVSTGIATLDAALGVGGLVRGQQVIVYGTPGSGKSSLAYTAVGNLMQRDPDAMVCIVDVERAANMEWLSKFGIDPGRTVIIEEPTVEADINALQQAVRANAFDYIIVDSLGAVMRAVEFDGKDGKGGDAEVVQVGGSAKAITRMVNMANAEMVTMDKAEISGHEVIKPVILFINQVRANIGSPYGGTKMSGGYALEHMSSVVLKVQASGAANDKMWGTVNGKKVQVGSRVTCKVERNKNAPTPRIAGYNFCWEECPEHDFGIDSAASCLDLALEYGVFEAKGAWVYYGEHGQPGFVRENGRAAMLEVLRDNPEFMAEVYAKTMKEINKHNDEIMEEADAE